MSTLLESCLTATQRAEAEAADMAQRNGLPAVFAGAFLPLLAAQRVSSMTPMDWEEEERYERADQKREDLMEERAEREERGL
jgi:hypothetical protein